MSVDWSYYDKEQFKQINDMYLPVRDQGNTVATQTVVAVNKIIYKWYNDGDVFDNTSGYLEGWVNDLSSYANWLYNYIPRSRKILDKVFTCKTEGEYEDLLRELADNLLDAENLENLNKKPMVGSVYDCDGPFQFTEWEDDEDEDEWER